MRINFSQGNAVTAALKLLADNQCVGLSASPLFALLHQIGKVKMRTPICLDANVVSKIIKSFPDRLSGKYIGNA